MDKRRLLWLFNAGSRIIYLLRDKYITDRAAGTVNGTASEPGPGGNRTITGNLSLSNGYVIPTAAGDAVAYSALARTIGRVLVVRSMGNGTVLGLSSNSNGKSQVIGFNVEADGNIRYPAGGFSNMDAANNKLSGAIYRMILIAKPAGAWHFIQGGRYSYPTLIYYQRIQNTATVYPGWYTTYTNNPAMTDFCIPENTYIPTALVSDSFASSSGLWTDVTGTSSVASGAMVITPSAGVGIVTCETGKEDVLAIARPSRSAGDVGIIVKYVDADNYIRVIHDGTNLKVIQRLAGVESTLSTVAVAYSAGKDIAVETQGTSLRGIYNDTSQAAAVTINAALADATKAGIWSSDASNSVDEFETYARGTDNEYSDLGAAAITKGDLLVTCDGDSITAGQGATPYPTQLFTLQPREIQNIGISGQTIAQMVVNTGAKIDGCVPYWNKSIVVLLGGTNDILNGDSQATVYNNIVSYCQSRQAAGSLVVVMTILKRSSFNAEKETIRQGVNAAILSNYATFANAVIDIAAYAEFQNTSDLTYFQDGVHPTTAGLALIAAGVKAQLDLM